ncbi:Receptor-type tyrosine-protein phosphatase eta [Channa argus]|uniref:protein-tyrosine-phosphatase n=1 Tax=Channa argus TaxID=215402 RepID=A0A6G1QPS3_CHAAH|nr:Receptor-type tyrosine-protein phosphatase eta [Channa argus]
MVKPLSVKITSNHLLLCIFLCLLWGVTDINTSTTTVTNTKVSSTTISTAISPPENVKSVSRLRQNESRITLKWDKVNNISTYMLQYDEKGSDIINASYREKSVEHVVSFLAAGKIFNFTLITVLERINSTGFAFTAVIAPPNVNEFRSVGQNETSITLQWKKVNGILDYVLQYGNISGANVRGEANNDNVTYTASHLNSGTQYNFTLFTVFENVSSTGVHLISVTDLKSGTEYYFTLFTVFKNVRSTGVNLSAVTAPTNAENFRSVGQNETSITLQWKKVDDILDYVLQYGNISGANVRGEANNDNVTYTASHLNSGTQYNFTLFTVFKNVRSTGVNLSAVTAPPNAEEFKSVGQNETSVTLQWIKGNGIYNYTLKFNNTEKNVEDENVTFIASHLKSGTEYYFTLFTVFKNVRSTGVNLSAVTAPPNAEEFKSVGQNETSVTLQWIKGDGIYNYTLKFNDKETVVTGNEDNNVMFIASDLKSGTEYGFTLFTVFKNVRSTGVNLSAVTAPANAENSGENFRSVGQNETSITLQWKKVNGILDYVLQYGNISGANVRGEANNDNVTYTASHLNSGTQYNFTLFTVFENVSSTGVHLISVTGKFTLLWYTYINTPPNAEEFKSVGQNETSVTLQWIKGNGIYNYTLKFNNTEKNVEDENVTFIASHLKSGTEYYFTLFTVFKNVRSTGVNLSAVTAPPNAEEFKSVGQNETSVTLQWIKGDGIYNYTLKFNDKETVVTGNEDNNVMFIASDLKSGTEYGFTLFTVFKNVRSSGVNLSAVTAPANAENSGENFRSVGQNETSITLQWKKVNGILDYVLQYGNISGANVRGEANNDNVTYTASHLNSGTQYNFTLFTVFENVSSTGVHLISVTGKFTLLWYTYINTPPNAEEFKSVGQNETSVTLQWIKGNGIYNYTLKFNNTEKNVEDENVTFIASHLKSGTEYYFTLFTVFKNVRSTGVNLSAVTAPPNAEEFKSVGQNETSVTLQWIKGDGIYNYTLKFNDKETVVTGNEDNNVMFIASDLKSGTEYGFTLFTVFKNVRSSGVNLSAVTAPTNAENFRSVGQNETSITLRWKKVNGIFNYIIKFNNIEKNVTGNENNNVTFIASDLKSGTQYHFTLFTVFKNVRSTGVNLSAVTAPSNTDAFKSIGQNETSITLQWKKVEGISKYTLAFNKTRINVNAEKEQVTHTILELKSGTKYNFTLFTEFKNVSSSGQNLTAVTAPENVKNVQVLGQNESSITLTWGKVNNISTYILQYVNNNDTILGQSSPFDQGTLVTYAVTLLTPGRKYNFIVITVFEEVSSTGYRFNAATGPPSLRAHCEYEASGYSIKIILDETDGVWTAVEINVIGKTLVYNKNQNYKISGFQPAKNYEVSLTSLSGNVSSSTAFVFECSTDPRALNLWLYIFVTMFKMFFHMQSLAPVGTEQTRRAAVLPENKPKNRFNNVLPYDWSRVRLTTHLSGTSDYINANYMPGFNSNREYIATQGPLPSTVNDFWRMIWEQRVMGIVMVTNCTEGGRTKCEQYWPANRNPCLYDKLEVTMIYEQQEPNWTLREFNVKHRNSSESRTVKHFHFTAWPDHGVPQSTEVLIQFRALVRQHIERQGNGAPTVVHCSAGVGRTGTIIALDVFLQEMDKKGEIGINAFVHKMRLSRPHMVQTESQYIFLHQCIVDSLHPCENNEENIYENTEGIYVNATALREFRNTTND